MEELQSILLIISGLFNIVISIIVIKQYIELLDTKFLLDVERKGNKQWKMMCESYKNKLEKRSNK